MKLAISLLALSIILGGTLGDSDPDCLTSCPQVLLSGFPLDGYDGLWTTKNLPGANRKPIIYVKEVPYYGNLTIEAEIYFSNMKMKYQLRRNYIDVYKEKGPRNYDCLEDVMKDVTWQNSNGFGATFQLTAECAPPTTTPPTTNPPTTTTSLCKPCRKVVDADAALNGYYELQDTGDSRCKKDGCLYKKSNTEDLYCFEDGPYTIEDTCPST